MEASLAGTALSQSDVVNWLADELLKDVVTAVAGEVSDVHEALTSVLLESA
jgi:hypothetical protein